MDNFIQQCPETDWLSGLRAWRYYRECVVKDRCTQPDRHENDGHLSNVEHEDSGQVEIIHGNEDDGDYMNQDEDNGCSKDQNEENGKDQNENSGHSEIQNEDNGHTKDQNEDKNDHTGHKEGDTCTTVDGGPTDSPKQEHFFVNHEVAREFEDITFRVSCTKVAPKLGFTSMDAACCLGTSIGYGFQWKVDLKHCDVEVILRINDDSVIVGVALMRDAMFKRNVVEFGPTNLRATIAYGMLR